MQEFIANLLSLRAKVLEKGLRNMLADKPGAVPTESDAATSTAAPPRDLVYRLYAHPLVRSLYRESRRWLGRSKLTLPKSEARAKEDAEQELAAARQAAARD